jgi:prophage regulatory protein
MNGQSILRLRDVLRRLSISRSSLYALIKAGKFNQPISLGPRSVGWLESDVTDFITKRVQHSRPESRGVAA